MKLRLMTAALAAFALSGTALAQDSSQSADQAKQSAHDAWQNTKDTASNGWDATKQGTKDAYNDAKQGAKDTYHRAHNKLAARSVRGTLTKLDKDSLTIKEANGREVALKRDAATHISNLNHELNATLEEGSEVRASYRLDKNGDKWAKSVVITASPKASTHDLDDNAVDR